MKKIFLVLGVLFLVSSPVYPEPYSGLEEVRGKKISLDIRPPGMDVVEVLKIFSMQSGLNIVAGKNVRGTVTMFLKDVDVANAFEIIMAAYELAYEKEGDIINVMTERDYELIYGRKFHDRTQIKVAHLKYAAAADVAKALNEIKSRVGKIVADERSNTLVMLDSPVAISQMEEAIRRLDSLVRTEVFALNYAKAKDLEPRITELVTKGTGLAKMDEPGNKLVVTDTPQKIEEIRRIISALDTRTREVLIEAKIIEVTLNDEFKMGVNWKLLVGKELGVQFTDSTITDRTLDAAIQEPFVLGELATKTLTGLNAGQFEGLIKLLRSIGKTDVLSTPRITAVNNQEAKILVGQKEPFLTTTSSYDAGGVRRDAEQVTFIETGVKLNVTPTINEEGFITMKIKPEVSSATDKNLGTDASPKKVPLVSSSEAETTVMVKDGATIVLAGLMKDKTVKQLTKVPFLGDVPLFGLLFRSKRTSAVKTELVILLTPTIITGEEGAPALAKTTFSGEKEQSLSREPSVREELGEALFSLPDEPRPYAFKEAEKTLERIEETDAYNEYYLTLSDRLMQYVAQNYIGVGVQGEAQIFFTLKSDGTLDGEPVVVGEVDTVLRNLAIECVKSAGPYPRFPVSLAEPKQTFNILLSFSG
jgi:MSHA type pilus biogenesis protein MshL